MINATEQITLAEFMQMAIESREINLHVAMPAKVESYNASKQTVDVVPQLNRSMPDGDGNYVSQKLPKLADVPVAFPRGGGYAVSFPIKAGDFVLLVFSERNIGQWRSTGTQGDPGDLGMHTLDGAVAIPGVYPDKAALASASASKMVLGKDDTGTSRIEITSSGVFLGAGATKEVARKGDSVNAGTLTGTTPVGGGAVTFTYVPAGGGAPVVSLTAAMTGGKITSGSSKIKAVD